MKFRNEEAFSAAALQAESALARLPGIRISPSRPLPEAMNWTGWLFQAETPAGTMRYRAELKSRHIRIRAILPPGLRLGDPFRPAAGRISTTVAAQIEGRDLADPDRVDVFLWACANRIRNTLLAPDLPAPQENPDLRSHLTAALHAEHPERTTAMLTDGATAMFAAVHPLGVATPADAVDALRIRTDLIVDELFRAAGRFSAADFRELVRQALASVRRLQTTFAPAVRALAADAAAEPEARTAALHVLHETSMVAGALAFRLRARPLSTPRPDDAPPPAGMQP